jgi:multidrug efflux pump subunit AcrA (membrane-fusion protein)
VKKLLFLLVLIGLALAGVAWWLNSARHRGTEPGEYTTLPVEYGAIRDVVSATGLVQPRQTFPVGTELAGKVVAVLADYNQTVAEGDVLLRLDDRMARQRLEEARVGVKQAQAALDTAEKTAQRERNRSPEVRSQWDVELAESQVRRARVAVEAAQVKVREAELGLSLTTVRVPVLSRPAEGSASPGHPERTGVGTLSANGHATGTKQTFIVLDRKVSLNQETGPPASAHLFTLAGDMARMRVLTQVVEGDVGKIRRGLGADFTVAGGENAPTFPGTVEEIRLVPTSERGAVFYTVVLNAPNRKDGRSGEWMLRPGLTASVDVIRQVHDPVWKLPSAALNVQPEEGTLAPGAQEKLARGPAASGREQWRTVWVVGPENKPWPVFVRVGGTNAKGEPGLQDAQFTEVLEWGSELRPQPGPADKTTYPRVIIGLPPPKKGGFFNAPTIKF